MPPRRRATLARRVAFGAGRLRRWAGRILDEAARPLGDALPGHGVPPATVPPEPSGTRRVPPEVVTVGGHQAGRVARVSHRPPPVGRRGDEAAGHEGVDDGRLRAPGAPEAMYERRAPGSFGDVQVAVGGAVVCRAPPVPLAATGRRRPQRLGQRLRGRPRVEAAGKRPRISRVVALYGRRGHNHPPRPHDRVVGACDVGKGEGAPPSERRPRRHDVGGLSTVAPLDTGRDRRPVALRIRPRHPPVAGVAIEAHLAVRVRPRRVVGVDVRPAKRVDATPGTRHLAPRAEGVEDADDLGMQSPAPVDHGVEIEGHQASPARRHEAHADTVGAAVVPGACESVGTDAHEIGRRRRPGARRLVHAPQRRARGVAIAVDVRPIEPYRYLARGAVPEGPRGEIGGHAPIGRGARDHEWKRRNGQAHHPSRRRRRDHAATSLRANAHACRATCACTSVNHNAREVQP